MTASNCLRPQFCPQLLQIKKLKQLTSVSTGVVWLWWTFFRAIIIIPHFYSAQLQFVWILILSGISLIIIVICLIHVFTASCHFYCRQHTSMNADNPLSLSPLDWGNTKGMQKEKKRIIRERGQEQCFIPPAPAAGISLFSLSLFCPCDFFIYRFLSVGNYVFPHQSSPSLGSARPFPLILIIR